MMRKLLSIFALLLSAVCVYGARPYRDVFPANFVKGLPAGWSIESGATYEQTNGGLKVTCARQNNGKYRGDVKYNMSPNSTDNDFTINASKYKVFAVSFIGARPSGGNLKLQNISVNGAWIGNSADYGLKPGNNAYSGDVEDADGNHTYYWMLGGEKWNGLLTVGKVELVIADIPNEANRTYILSRICWFESEEAVKEAVLNKVASVGAVNYPSFAEAWHNAESGDAIELHKDVALSECLSTKGRTLSIKGNGHAITAQDGYEGPLFKTEEAEDPDNVREKFYELNHPCLLHTQADFDYVRPRLKEDVYAKALKKLKSGRWCDLNHTPHPVKYLARLDANNWADISNPNVKRRWENAGILDLWYSGIHNNYTNLMRDAAAAYQLALLYKLEDNAIAAEKAIDIIEQWANENEGILRNSKGELIDPNEKLILFQPYQMAVAAEMLRDYKGWGESEDFEQVCDWVDSSFYDMAHGQLELQNQSGGGHYWMNWDLCAMTSILAIGVLTDNQDYINEAIMYYKGMGGGPGNIYKGVPFLHDDSESDELLGQGNECGRDQGHNSLCVSVLGTFCQMALALGEDLFAYADYRALDFVEYVAKYNLAKAELYPDPMATLSSMRVGSADEDFEYPHASFPFNEYTYGDGGKMTHPSENGRGAVRPGWDLWAGYANAHGRPAIYCNKFAERIRPDGGGGHYSPNSGGFDQLGITTLLYYRP